MRPKFSTLFVGALALTLAALLGIAVLLGGSTDHTDRTVVTVRVWDERVAAAYRTSFAEFTRKHPDVEVRVDVVAYSSYFDTLRTDVAGGGADDVFWLSNAYFANYADNTRRFSELMMTLPMEIARQGQAAFQQGAGRMTQAVERAGDEIKRAGETTSQG